MSKVRLSDIAVVASGNPAPQAKDFTPDGIPFVRAGSLSGLLETGDLSNLERVDSETAAKLRLRLFPAGTVLFAKSGMSCLKGYVYTLPRECYVVSHLACIIPRQDYSKYLQYYFRYWKPNRLVENPSFPSIKLSKISGIELNLPDICRAKEIVDNLEAVQREIDVLKLLLKELDRLVKSRFDELLESCDMDDLNKLQSYTKRVKVGFVGTVGNYYTDESGIPMVRTSNITSMGLDLSDIKYVTVEFDRKNSKSHLHSGDVIIARHGENGRACVYTGPDAQCLNVVVIEPNPDILIPLCLENLMNCDYVRKQIASKLVGSTQKVVNTKTVASVMVPRIPLALQQEFATFVAQVDKSRFVVQQAIEQLETLKASLMQEYFG